MGGYRHRYMYYLTGLPGWMRFGFSPGWLGTSPTGMGPGATYLMTGTWPTPQAQAWWQAMQTGQAPYPAFGGVTPGYTAPGSYQGAGGQQELQLLQNQAQALKEQLERINQRIKELEKEK